MLVPAAIRPFVNTTICPFVVVSTHDSVSCMSNRRIALVIGTIIGLIAIVAWVAEIDLVFQESAEEQEPNQKSLVIDESASESKSVEK